MMLEKITYDNGFKLYRDNNGLASEQDIASIITILREHAPISTRTDVKFWMSDEASYCFPLALINSHYFHELLDEETDGITLTEIEECKMAHELTHAHTCRAFKEPRGYAKLMIKMGINPEMKEKLEPIAQELKKGIKSTNHIYNEIYTCQESIAHACESEYGKLTEKMHRVEESMEACKDLIGMIGIDGARSFVRNKVRKMYVSGNAGEPLIEDIENFKEDVIAFFDMMPRKDGS